jgi:hypothetical protein
MKIARVEKTDEFKYKLSGKNIERFRKRKKINGPSLTFFKVEF